MIDKDTCEMTLEELKIVVALVLDKMELKAAYDLEHAERNGGYNPYDLELINIDE
jgi:hypothetical protein